MKKAKTPQPVLDADAIIDQFTSRCDIEHAATIFVKLTLANIHFRHQLKDIPTDAPYDVDPDDAQTMAAITAINAMLYEIERTLRVEANGSKI
jgi:hypothetical protein